MLSSCKAMVKTSLLPVPAALYPWTGCHPSGTRSRCENVAPRAKGNMAEAKLKEGILENIILFAVNEVDLSLQRCVPRGARRTKETEEHNSAGLGSAPLSIPLLLEISIICPSRTSSLFDTLRHDIASLHLCASLKSRG